MPSEFVEIFKESYTKVDPTEDFYLRIEFEITFLIIGFYPYMESTNEMALKLHQLGRKSWQQVFVFLGDINKNDNIFYNWKQNPINSALAPTYENLIHFFNIVRDWQQKRKYKILVVDDSTTNVVLLEAILDEKGYKVETALNVKEAYTIIDNEIPDPIITDLLMPKISGFDFLAEIRQNIDTFDIPVIVASALTDEENVDKIMAMGAIDFINIPLIYNILLSELSQCLFNLLIKVDIHC